MTTITIKITQDKAGIGFRLFTEGKKATKAEIYAGIKLRDMLGALGPLVCSVALGRDVAERKAAKAAAKAPLKRRKS